MITHAPSLNFIEATMMSTTKDSTAPMPLIQAPQRHPSSFSRKWCFVMPACESVKLVNTPMA